MIERSHRRPQHGSTRADRSGGPPPATPEPHDPRRRECGVDAGFDRCRSSSASRITMVIPADARLASTDARFSSVTAGSRRVYHNDAGSSVREMTWLRLRQGSTQMGTAATSGNLVGFDHGGAIGTPKAVRCACSRISSAPRCYPERWRMPEQGRSMSYPRGRPSPGRPRRRMRPVVAPAARRRHRGIPIRPRDRCLRASLPRRG